MLGDLVPQVQARWGTAFKLCVLLLFIFFFPLSHGQFLFWYQKFVFCCVASRFALPHNRLSVLGSFFHHWTVKCMLFLFCSWLFFFFSFSIHVPLYLSNSLLSLYSLSLLPSSFFLSLFLCLCSISVYRLVVFTPVLSPIFQTGGLISLSWREKCAKTPVIPICL